MAAVPTANSRTSRFASLLLALIFLLLAAAFTGLFVDFVFTSLRAAAYAMGAVVCAIISIILGVGRIRVAVMEARE